MNNKFITLIKESIKIELGVSSIYFLFSRLFKDDEYFWWKLMLEEKNHAALLRSGLEQFEPLGLFPGEICPDSLEMTKQSNKKLNKLLEELSENHPSREQAFNIAIELENSAGELHFQDFFDKSSNSKICDIFKSLNEDDKDHAQRIMAYMKEKNIPIDSHLMD